MMTLPEDFIRETRQLMGEDRFDRFIGAFDEEAPVSIRINPKFLRKEEGGKWKEVTDCYDLVPFLCCLCARRCCLVVIWLQIDIFPKI